MARKETPALEQAATRSASLAGRILSGYGALRAALLGGQATAPIRAEISALERAVTDEAAAREAAEAERDERETAEVADNAQLLANGVAIRLAARLAALQPPPAPVR